MLQKKKLVKSLEELANSPTQELIDEIEFLRKENRILVKYADRIESLLDEELPLANRYSELYNVSLKLKTAAKVVIHPEENVYTLNNDIPPMDKLLEAYKELDRVHFQQTAARCKEEIDSWPLWKKQATGALSK